jgi:hypothetical protein
MFSYRQVRHHSSIFGVLSNLAMNPFSNDSPIFLKKGESGFVT